MAIANQPVDERPDGKKALVWSESDLDYEIFISVITIFALMIAAALFFLQLAPAADQVLLRINGLITFIFLADFIHLFRRAENKIAYIKSQGWLDLLGSLPFHPVFRVFRIPRLVIVGRELRQYGAHPIWDGLVHRRAQNALRFTGLAVLFVLTLGSVMVLQFESQAPTANILNGQEAIWWAIVTIATVGYGDFYPVTDYGRLVGIVLMIVGVGMFGVLSSYLAKSFLSPTKKESEDQNRREKERMAEALRVGLRAELAPLKSEIESLRAEVTDLRKELASKGEG